MKVLLLGWTLLSVLASPLLANTKKLQPVKPRPRVGKSVSYQRQYAAGVACHVVYIDLRNKGLRFQTVRAQDLGGRFHSFASFVKQTRPLAAINGTFFDVRTGTIICNLVRNGRLLESGAAGHTLVWRNDGKLKWMSTAGKAGGRIQWKDARTAVSAGPTLVRNRRIVLCPEAEGFSDPGLFRRAARSGLGITKSGRLMFVTVNRPITLGQFAKVMHGLGVSDAINLDGGTSTGLYARGKFLSKPGRALTNVLVVSTVPQAQFAAK